MAHGRDRLGRLETNYVLVSVRSFFVINERPEYEEGGEKERSTRRQAVKVTVFKTGIAREPARDRRENRARFVPNDKRKKHTQLCPSVFFSVNSYWCAKRGHRFKKFKIKIT
jgi:hypothetical protein